MVNSKEIIEQKKRNKEFSKKVDDLENSVFYNKIYSCPKCLEARIIKAEKNFIINFCPRCGKNIASDKTKEDVIFEKILKTFLFRLR